VAVAAGPYVAPGAGRLVDAAQTGEAASGMRKAPAADATGALWALRRYFFRLNPTQSAPSYAFMEYRSTRYASGKRDIGMTQPPDPGSSLYGRQ